MRLVMDNIVGAGCIFHLDIRDVGVAKKVSQLLSCRAVLATSSTKQNLRQQSGIPATGV